jgi:hypothetical protein
MIRGAGGLFHDRGLLQLLGRKFFEKENFGRGSQSDWFGSF